MSKVSICIVNYSHDSETIKECMDSLLAQSFEDFTLVYMDNQSKHHDTVVPFVREHYSNHPKVAIVDNGTNLGYTGGYNKFFKEYESPYLMVINPDTKTDKDYLQTMITYLDAHPNVAAATSKILKPFKNDKGESLLDSTGVMVTRTRSAFDRGHLEVDHGQYDNQTDIFGVSGAGAIYRRSALLDTQLSDGEYFDNDYLAYMEDVDLSWRLKLKGYEIKFVPNAILYHERNMAANEGGMRNFRAFFKHQQAQSSFLKRLGMRNRLWTIYKDDFGWTFWKDAPFIIAKEIAKIGYLILFKRDVLPALGEFYKKLPEMKKKRKLIQSTKTVSSKDMAKWFK
jgi:GT2 family glycosyltransferase